MPLSIEEKRDIVARIARSLHFQAAQKEKGILLFLAERDAQGDPKTSAQQIWKRFYTGPMSTVSRHTVASEVRHLRAGLKSYFEEDEHGRAEVILVSIPRRSYQLIFEARTPLGPRGLSQLFWKPYLPVDGRQAIETLFLYPEPLFFRCTSDPVEVPVSNGLIFMRHILLNQKKQDDAPSDEEVERASRFLAAELRDGRARRCHQYMHVSLSRCILHLTKWLTKQNVPTSDEPSYFLDNWGAVQRYNLIVPGNSRISWVLDDLPRHLEFGFKMTPDAIVSQAGVTYRDFSESRTRGLRHVYGFVTRMPNPLDVGKVVTLIAAHHDPAFNGIAEFLTSDEHVVDIFRRIGLSNAELPDTFQILFECDLDERDRFAQPARAVAHWLPSR